MWVIGGHSSTADSALHGGKYHCGNPIFQVAEAKIIVLTMFIVQTIFGHMTFLPPSTKCLNPAPTCVTQLYNSSFMIHFFNQEISQHVYEKEKIRSPLVSIIIFILYR